jgi:hypothetical protein
MKSAKDWVRLSSNDGNIPKIKLAAVVVVIAIRLRNEGIAIDTESI